jgi:predicted short-subunit dehydrogenase-like oxidoreductase (DUF2520 family)
MNNQDRLSDLPISIIGAGRLGSALGRLLFHVGYPIDVIIDKDIQKARACQSLCDARLSSDRLDALDPRASFVFIAVPDDQISIVCEKINRIEILKRGTVVAHTSGLWDSRLLESLKGEKIWINSFHPCYSIPLDFQGDFNDVHFALEGDPNGCERLKRVVQNLGGVPIMMTQNQKVAYHTACTMASNYLVILLDSAFRIIRTIGENGDPSLLFPLIRGTLANIEEKGTEDALTGPIQRGDSHTIEKHLEILKSLDLDSFRIYSALGLATLTLASRQQMEPEITYKLKDLFQESLRSSFDT